jgi:peptidoglycan-associated lipoprotein
MKLSKFSTLLVVGLVLTVAASGCRKRPGQITPLPGSRTTGIMDDNGGRPLNENPDTTGGGVKGSDALNGIPSNSPDARKDWVRNRETFAANTVHFAFDSSVVSAADRPNVAAVADYLKANPLDAVEIEGHCDERGTEEYNRSLGERRALALREQLVSLGVDSTRVDTLTFGKDKPVATGHNEAAWRQNRRGVFLLEVHPK